MTQTQHIRRRTNGTIDIDHYRNRALMERKAAMTGSMSGAMSFGSLRILAGLFMGAATAMVPPAMHDTASNGAGRTVTAALVTR
jgi:TRAP-type C4-dicarboxylate transport system substrate-binding protein